MEIYKGTSAFSGIAIGKILYYHRGEYQIRQSMVDNVKKELDRLDNARTAVKNQIQHMYKNGAPLPKEQELTLKRQLKLLSGGSFQRAVESMITTEKVSAAYAVQTTRDELANVFRKLEDEAVKEQISIHVPSWGTTANFHKYSLFFYAINIIFLLFIIPSLFSLVLFMLLF